MPNGRHGAVLIPCLDLCQFLDSIPGDPVVGKVGGKATALGAVKRLAEAHADPMIFVEGQEDDSRYAVVFHFRSEHLLGSKESWLWVGEDSPIYEAVKDFWLASHHRRDGE